MKRWLELEHTEKRQRIDEVIAQWQGQNLMSTEASLTLSRYDDKLDQYMANLLLDEVRENMKYYAKCNHDKATAELLR